LIAWLDLKLRRHFHTFEGDYPQDIVRHLHVYPTICCFAAPQVRYDPIERALPVLAF